MLFFFLRGNLDSTKAHHSFGRPVQPHLSGTLPMRRTNPSHLRLGDRCRSSPSICIDPRCGSRSHSRRPCLYSSKRGVILHFYSNFAIKTNTSCSIPKKASPTSRPKPGGTKSNGSSKGFSTQQIFRPKITFTYCSFS